MYFLGCTIPNKGLGFPASNHIYQESHKRNKIHIDLNLPKEKKEKIIRDLRKEMENAAKDLDFMEAARLRDLISEYKKGG